MSEKKDDDFGAIASAFWLGLLITSAAIGFLAGVGFGFLFLGGVVMFLALLSLLVKAAK